MLPDPFSRPHKEKREKAVWLRETIRKAQSEKRDPLHHFFFST